MDSINIRSYRRRNPPFCSWLYWSPTESKCNGVNQIHIRQLRFQILCLFKRASAHCMGSSAECTGSTGTDGIKFRNFFSSYLYNLSISCCNMGFCRTKKNIQNNKSGNDCFNNTFDIAHL